MTRPIALCLLGLGLLPVVVAAQTAAAPGTRAAGMGGAFTAVADDASAFYWNPAGLAAGAIVSLVLDFGQGSATPGELARGQEHSTSLVALTAPALGLGYYRLRTTAVSPGVVLLAGDEPGGSRDLSGVGPNWAESLVTHHVGATVVQSITQGVAVGSTLKMVRGIAGAQVIPSGDLDSALDAGADLLGRATNRFDLDVGVVAYGGPLKAGLVVRNLREPSFPTPGEDGREFVLERQARAGLSYAVGNWIAAADLDLTRRADVFGDYRELALGTEGRITQRLWVRTGLRWNTADDDEPLDDRRRAAVSLGGSYAARGGLLVDGHYSAGDGRAGHQWGVAARFVY